MPSWAPASISGRFSPARIPVTALRLPCSARVSRRSRRAEISANSAPTKNALAANNAMVRMTPRKSPIGIALSVVVASTELGEFELVDASAVHPDHGREPAHRIVDGPVRVERRQLDRLALLGDVPEQLQHQPADRLVFALRRPESGGAGDLVDAQQTRDMPALAGLHHVCGR